MNSSDWVDLNTPNGRSILVNLSYVIRMEKDLGGCAILYFANADKPISVNKPYSEMRKLLLLEGGSNYG